MCIQHSFTWLQTLFSKFNSFYSSQPSKIYTTAANQKLLSLSILTPPIFDIGKVLYVCLECQAGQVSEEQLTYWLDQVVMAVGTCFLTSSSRCCMYIAFQFVVDTVCQPFPKHQCRIYQQLLASMLHGCKVSVQWTPFCIASMYYQ